MKKIIIPLIFAIAFGGSSAVLGIMGTDWGLEYYFTYVLVVLIAGFIEAIGAIIVAYLTKSHRFAVTLDLAIASVLSLGCALAALFLKSGSKLENYFYVSAAIAGILFVALIIAMIIVNCFPEKSTTPERKAVADIPESDLSFCPYCGVKMATSDALFCTKCGKKIK